MKEWIKPNRMVFKIGTLEWLNYFGLPTGFLAYSIISLYFLLTNLDSPKSETPLFGFILTLLLGLTTYYLQIRRLKFKKIKLKRDIESFKNEVRAILTNNNWEIDYDNKQYIQATYRGSLFNLDMLTLKFKKSEIQWNVIHHPFSHNSIAALLTLNRAGYKAIKKIKTIA